MIHFIKKYYIQLITVFIFFVIIIIMISQSFNMIDIVKNKSAELKQVHLDHALAEEFLNHIYVFKKNISYIEQDTDWTNVLLPNIDDEKVHLFSTLEQLAQDTGNNGITLALKSVDTKPAKATKANDKTQEGAKPAVDSAMNIEIAITGEYNDLIYFLQKIENMEYFANVSSINIVKTADSIKKSSNENDDEEVRTNLLRTTMNVAFFLDKK